MAATNATTTDTTSSGPERSIEHTIEDGFDGDALSTLSEEKEDAVQLQEIRRRTIEPGLMRLPVSTVTTAENSPQIVIEVDHPVEDDPFRFYLEKPMDGWSDEYTLVRVLDWYGVDTENPHVLQTQDVYVEKDSERSERNHGWVLVRPPDHVRPPAPMREQLRRKWEWLSGKQPSASNARMYAFIMSGVVGGSVLSSVLSIPVSFAPSVVVSTLVTVVTVLAATLVGTGVLEP